jgi:hypothetical protein
MTRHDTAEDQDEETIVEVDLKMVVKQAMAEFDDVASVTIDHLVTYEQPGSLVIRIYTGEVDSFEDYLHLFSDDHRITIDRDDETLVVPFTIFATFDGPVTWNSIEQTTVYIDENVLGAHSIQLEDGLAYVRDKLEQPDQWDRTHSYSLDRIRNYTE